MSGEVHLHRKVVGSLNLGILSNYLLYAFFWGGVQLILNRGSISSVYVRSDSSVSIATIYYLLVNS